MVYSVSHEFNFQQNFLLLLKVTSSLFNLSEKTAAAFCHLPPISSHVPLLFPEAAVCHLVSNGKTNTAHLFSAKAIYLVFHFVLWPS